MATGSGTVNTATNPTTNKTVNDMLGKDAFFRLLVTQLRHQDPLSPMDDREFVAQMAQFSTLEQMQSLNGQMLRLSAMAMLGQEVLIMPNNGGEPAAGIVERVVTLNGSVQVAVNGQLYPVEWVNAVQPVVEEEQYGPQTL
ncbi:MAG TPA: flagellar hook capping protein [Firmicutes bacterium]|nr:flagellar hook capping protein [Bacillota bacterium]